LRRTKYHEAIRVSSDTVFHKIPRDTFHTTVLLSFHSPLHADPVLAAAYAAAVVAVAPAVAEHT